MINVFSYVSKSFINELNDYIKQTNISIKEVSIALSIPDIKLKFILDGSIQITNDEMWRIEDYLERKKLCQI